MSSGLPFSSTPIFSASDIHLPMNSLEEATAPEKFFLSAYIVYIVSTPLWLPRTNSHLIVSGVSGFEIPENCVEYSPKACPILKYSIPAFNLSTGNHAAASLSTNVHQCTQVSPSLVTCLSSDTIACAPWIASYVKMSPFLNGWSSLIGNNVPSIPGASEYVDVSSVV